MYPIAELNSPIPMDLEGPRDQPVGFSYIAVTAPEDTKLVKLLPKKYWEYEDVFSGTLAGIIATHSDFDYAIDLMPSKTALYMPIYNLSQRELTLLKEYLNSALKKG